MESNTVAVGLLCLSIGMFFLVGAPVGAVSLLKFYRWWAASNQPRSDRESEGEVLFAGAVLSWFALVFIAVALAVMSIETIEDYAAKLARRIP
jgi:hypothetical protein